MLNPENRKLSQGECSQCGKEIYKRAIHFKLAKNSFCSKECQSIFRETGEYKFCKQCNKVLYRTKAQLKRSKSGNFFCNRSCATSFNNKKYKSNTSHPNYIDGASTYRTKAINKYGAICNQCGYSKHKEVLEVHHIDKDRTNNKLKNLEVLCSNCHKEKHMHL